MKALGFKVVIEEGETGQFELFKRKTVDNSDYWTSYMTESDGVPKFFTLHDIELKLSGHTPKK